MEGDTLLVRMSFYWSFVSDLKYVTLVFPSEDGHQSGQLTGLA